MAETDIRSDGSVSGSTKERIRHTAARMFSEHGFDNVSLRDITTGAGVNIAAVNYHFGSKVGLLTDVFAEYAAPVNVSRLKLLDECEQKAGDGPLPLPLSCGRCCRRRFTHRIAGSKAVISARCWAA